MTIEYLLTSLIVVLIPGTGALYAITIALTKGYRYVAIGALASTLGIVPHLLATILGVATILHASAELFETVRYLGVAYLLYLAWQTLKGSGAFRIEGADENPQDIKSILWTGFLVNVLNPKLSVFFLAFLPQFVSPNATSPAVEMLGLGAVFMGMTFLVFSFYGLFAAQLRQTLTQQPRFMTWFSRSIAAAFAGLGLKLALTER
jgi:threonine/homoserine/homoserine lactone efflux protein